jgi:hypothetical protein
MSLKSRFEYWRTESWKIPEGVSNQRPANCAGCPVFKSIDVYNSGKQGRVTRVRTFLLNSALGGYEFRKNQGVLPHTTKKLAEQAFALFDGGGKNAIVDSGCEGPYVAYTGEDGSPEYECNGVLHISSRAERLGLEE